MPTLITHLTPMQHMWLYEHQLTQGDSFEEKWHRFDPAFDTTIFRSRPQKRKLPFDDYPITAKPRSLKQPTDMESSRSQAKLKSERLATSAATSSSHGPRFPHTGDKLTWTQSRENLKVYYDHYGNCNVPQKYKDNRKLGRWVNKQRKKKKNPAKYGALTKEQIADLDSLGFVWNL